MEKKKLCAEMKLINLTHLNLRVERVDTYFVGKTVLLCLIIYFIIQLDFKCGNQSWKYITNLILVAIKFE